MGGGGGGMAMPELGNLFCLSPPFVSLLQDTFKA